MSWLNTLSDGSLSGFIKNLESRIDKVLDIPPSDDPPATRECHRDSQLLEPAAPTLQTLRGLSSTLSAGLSGTSARLPKESTNNVADEFFSNVFGFKSPETRSVPPSQQASPVKSASFTAERPRSASPTKSARLSLGAKKERKMEEIFPKDGVDTLDSKIVPSKTLTQEPNAIAEPIAPIKEPVAFISQLEGKDTSTPAPDTVVDPSTPALADTELQPKIQATEPFVAAKPLAQSQQSGATTPTDDPAAIIQHREAQLVKAMQENAKLNDMLAEVKSRAEIEALDFEERIESLQSDINAMQGKMTSMTEVI